MSTCGHYDCEEPGKYQGQPDEHWYCLSHAPTSAMHPMTASAWRLLAEAHRRMAIQERSERKRLSA